jgi:hypothetical protein
MARITGGLPACPDLTGEVFPHAPDLTAGVFPRPGSHRRTVPADLTPFCTPGRKILGRRGFFEPRPKIFGCAKAVEYFEAGARNFERRRRRITSTILSAEILSA